MHYVINVWHAIICPHCEGLQSSVGKIDTAMETQWSSTITCGYCFKDFSTPFNHFRYIRGAKNEVK